MTVSWVEMGGVWHGCAMVFRSLKDGLAQAIVQ
jgi:hypothetical protein